MARRRSTATTAACCSAVRPERRSRSTKRSCWASAAIVSSSAARRSMPPWSSYSASIVWWADRLAPLCWRTPKSTVRAVTSSGSGVRVAVVGLVERDVRDVGLPAAGHRDVEVLPRRRWRDDDVGRVDGDALGAVGGDGVAEVEVLADVLGGQHGLAPTSRVEAVDDDRAVAADVGDAPAVAVLHPAAATSSGGCGRCAG